MFCQNCGTKNEEGEKFCAGCGTAVSGIFNIPAAPVTQYQPKEKNNAVFLIFEILFFIVGMLPYIALTSSGDWEGESIAPATGLIAIGILFSIISLYRKPNKMYFWFCISPCILYVLWNAIVWFVWVWL